MIQFWFFLAQNLPDGSECKVSLPFQQQPGGFQLENMQHSDRSPSAGKGPFDPAVRCELIKLALSHFEWVAGTMYDIAFDSFRPRHSTWIFADARMSYKEKNNSG